MMKELRDIVGKDNVFDDQDSLDRYAGDLSLSPPKKPHAVVKPQNTQEVQKLVQFANKSLIPLIPSSSGVHFTGATLPEQGGVVVDLSRMNKILEIDTTNRKVKIEPGVTWHQLQQALKEHDQMALQPLFPHSRRSALTDSLERAPMLIPKYEYGDPVLTMEVALPNGDMFKTGSASDAHTDGAYPEGPGIDFFRFFQGAQGTMGIVTWLNIKTEFRPKHQKAFFTAFDTLEEAADPIYKIQRRHVGSECFVLSKSMLASLLSTDDKEFGKLMADLPPYTMVLVIAGAPRRPLERIAYEEKALMEIAADLNFAPAKTVGGIGGLGHTMIDKLRNPPADGEYRQDHLNGSTQDIFFITTMDRAQHFTDIVHGYAAGYGLPLDSVDVYMQPLERGRACHLSFGLPCDLSDAQDRESISDLFIDLSENLMAEGAFFTRPYGPWADMVYRKTTSYTTALKDIKKVFDPNNILNPGKLCH